MNGTLCELIKFESTDGYIYTGLLFTSENSKTTVIHVHGSCGDFISFGPLKTVASHYIKNGINFLTFNLKGHDCIEEGYWSIDYFGYVGGSITTFGECVEDIQNAINFCKKFSDNIVLQGHSFGCDRVVYYQLETKQYFNTVLISPCDSYKLQEFFLKGKSVEQHIKDIERITTINDTELLPNDVFGINYKEESYYIPVSKKTLLSIMKGPPYKLFRLDKRMDYYLPIKCIACIGNKDDLQIFTADKMFTHLRSKFEDLEEVLLDADHEFEPKGEELGKILAKWVVNL